MFIKINGYTLELQPHDTDRYTVIFDGVNIGLCAFIYELEITLNNYLDYLENKGWHRYSGLYNTDCSNK